jgi:malonyl CoA-acyl carrier protein transacylase
MARDYYLELAGTRRVFDHASNALGLDLAALCFDDDPRLNFTEFTQPALLTAEFGIYRGLVEEFGLHADIFAGHSVGEYTALVAAGVLPLGVAVQLLRLRGRVMQRSAPPGAVLVVRAEGALQRISRRRALEWGVEIACENSPNQIVLSGQTKGIERASAQIRDLFDGAAVELVTLNVSAPFHSSLLDAAEPVLRAALSGIVDDLRPANAARVLSNFTGDFHVADATSVIEALVSQVSGTVRWTENMARIAALSGQVYEIGPGRTLTGLYASIGQRALPLSSLTSARRQFGHAA